MNYDLIVLGGGPGGYTGAIAAAKEGLSVLLIERDRLGGVCLNRGCIPTKSLLKSADIYHSAVNSAMFGISVENVTYDENQIFGRKNAVVEKLVDGVNKLVAAAGVTVIKGEGRFVSSDTVEVCGERHTAKHIMLATGGRAVMPPIKGAELALSSDDVLEGKARGDRIVIVGGGVIGVEFATYFLKLKRKVIIVELTERILPTFERDISLNLAMCLKKLGAEIVTGAAVTEITATDVKYTARGKEVSTEYDSVIVCTGRRANVEGIGLENTKVKFDKYGVYADEFRHTDDGCIYAIGDVVAKNIQLAHNASFEAELVVHNILHGDVRKKPNCVPACVYTSPEVATAGMTESDCEAAGIETEVGKVLMGANGKAVLSGEDRGFIKVIFNKNNSKLLGVSLLSEHATDIIGAVTTLVEEGAERDTILNSVYPHPTVCEAFYEAVLDSVGRAIHIIKRR